MVPFRAWPPPREARCHASRRPGLCATPLGAAVGAGLALGGVILQAIVRNMLADPYILGVNSGASCGAALAILFGVGAGFGNLAMGVIFLLGAKRFAA